MIPKILLNFLFAFIATAGFSITFNVPKKEVVYCGMTGAFGWLSLKAAMIFGDDMLLVGTFIAVIVITWVSRILAFSRKTPISVYLVGGIIPLVPGTGIYQTMYYIVISENTSALSQGIETLKIAGIIAIGIIVVISIPWSFFGYFARPVSKLFQKAQANAD